MIGNELDLKTFLEELEDENLEDKTIELIEVSTEKITELSEDEFKEFMNRKGSD